MDERSLGLAIAGMGVIALMLGLAVASGLLSWFGRLPGDISIQSQNVRVYVPVASMLLLSAALTVLVAVVRRLF